MDHSLKLFNTLNKEKEVFQPLNPPHVGIYVCGPTVYSHAHLGHGRSAICFDILLRYLKQLGYKTRFVRNITDVGHLTDEDAGTGEDKILKKARLEQLEPMELVQRYTNSYHDDIDSLNCLRPDIEPTATGHIPEQIEFIEKLIDNGFAYEVRGSVYFDVSAYSQQYTYPKLMPQDLEAVMGGAANRDLEGQDEKRHPADFALWKAAPESHIMKWRSPWGIGFPGWHLECTVMSTKYLGTKYDIHGGGMDLKFPHHDAEIAQSNGCINDPHSHELDEAKYWIHHNMITIDGEKMSRSKGNYITLQQLYTGDHDRLEQAYTPMTLRFFVLQSHYRGLMDFSNEALQAAEKALKKLNDVFNRLDQINPDQYPSIEPDQKKESKLAGFETACNKHMDDDLNTARVLAEMFEVSAIVNEIETRKQAPFPVSVEVFEKFKASYQLYFQDILGLIPEKEAGLEDNLSKDLMELIIELRKTARSDKNWPLSDKIRDGLGELKIKLKDTPQGTEWYVEN